MKQQNASRQIQVCPSMVQNLYDNLKSNGYSDSQIFSLAHELMILSEYEDKIAQKETFASIKSTFSPTSVS